MENEQIETQQPKMTSTRRRVFYALIIILAVVGSFRLGYVSGNKGFAFDPKSFKIVNQNEAPATVDYNLLWQALSIVNQKYIDKDHINQQDVLYGAIRGAVAAAGDDYTTYFDPKDLTDFNSQLGGSFEGIGASVGKSDGFITIIAPLEDSPAMKAGLVAKDIIAQINGESTADMSVDDAVGKIRGPQGTEVTLTIARPGQSQTFEVKIKRAKIDVKSVKLIYQTIDNKKIAVISLSQFGGDTNDLFAKAVTDLKAAGAQAVIIDERNNPGGYLDVAVNLASYWLPKGELVVTEARSGNDNQVYNSSGIGKLNGLKTIVLLNGGSASASEILAGALHDHHVATLVGEKSFGKGSVQQLFNLPDGKSAVKITVAKWITPGGKNLNKDGLEPDVPVKLTQDDVNAKRDPQMDKALEEAGK